MPHADFVHLRVHSAYSLSEGAITVKALPGLCREAGMPAVAVTDRNNLFGALEFSAAAAGAGVQPIIGCQLSVDLPGEDGAPGVASALGVASAPGGASAKVPSAPVVLLCQTESGYRNLLKLLRCAYLDHAEAHDPSVTLEELLDHAEDLILLTGGPEGPLGRLLLEGNREGAEALFLSLKEAFGDRLYVELQRHGLETEALTEGGFLELAYAHDVPLVATNEAFFATPDMYEAHDALICIAEGAYLAEEDRRRLTPEHWFKGAGDMRAQFSDLPEACDNTLVIAQRCAFMVEKIAPILPPFDCGAGRTEAEELCALAAKGLERRLEAAGVQSDEAKGRKSGDAKPYWERLDRELQIIIEMGFPGYFLIVADFIGWAKEQGIPVGPGRGSGAGSVVAWALRITDLDPIRFGLLFERFLNPERVSMPDFDVDFCQERRDEVIRYVQKKYGSGQVAQIITFGKLQARAVLRDVGRVLQMPYGYVDKICKLVPNNPANPVTLKEAIEGEPDLRRMMKEDPEVDRLVGMALKLEGLYRHASTHAAGVVIGDRPLEDLIPLYRDPRSDMPVTGFNMKWVESAGLVKFDFLGLKTLSVLVKAVELCRKKDVEIDLDHLPLDDAKTFEMIGRGETTGVFQLESQGMRDVLRQMKADSFEDIIAIVALYRPGPMDNIPSYIRRKHGEEEPDYLDPILEPILTETYGIMIYQEQVMQAAQLLSGYSLGGADLLRRAMGKKIKEEMDKQRQIFVDGAVKNNVNKGKASSIFDQVAKFAGYGFNKSHAAAYALVAYQTAYMKANHPVEFLAASMTFDIHNTDKLAIFRQELQRLGVAMLSPDVNRSDVEFSVERDDEHPEGAVRYALAGVKNVGDGAMRALVAERAANGPFADVNDFALRIDPKAMNKRQLENLIRAGALDCLDDNRRRLFKGADRILAEAAAVTAERNSNQIGLFGGGGEAASEASHLRLPSEADWPQSERLAEELSAIGFHLSAHPLDEYQAALESLRVKSFAEIEAAGRPGPCRLAGTVTSMKVRTSNRGSKFAFISFTDATGAFEATAFSEVLAAQRDNLASGASFVISATAEVDDSGTVRLVIQDLQDIDQATRNAFKKVRIRIADADTAYVLRDALREQGQGPVKISIATPAGSVRVSEGFAFSPQHLPRIKSLPGVLEVTAH